MMRKRKGRFLRALLYFFLILILITGSFVTWYVLDTKIEPPAVNTRIVKHFSRVEIGPDHYAIGNNWIKKNEYGLWEMYLEGKPFERGIISGKLTRELIFNQEEAFVDQIRTMIPSESYLKFLKYFIRFFNRDLDEYVLPEYQKEIYGISFSASDKFDFIGTKFERMLNYHAAHDIGHALQDLMLVGCTSFAANMGFSDSSFILGRNFDFYINEDFAKDKIVCFVNPDKGHEFAYVTWASFIGVVSGMNKQGITVTINAGKSDIPLKSATPISLVAREILQYASNINEAIAIARKRETFVAESILIGSAQDNSAVIIEKSPSRMDVFEVDTDFLVCSNHFQGDAFMADRANAEHIVESASAYRQERGEELLTIFDSITPGEAAYILRDRDGLHGRPIGIGNEKTMAQMISHHSVIFQPLKGNMWVSSQPYQFGEYLGYPLSRIFADPKSFENKNVFDTSMTIPADPFVLSQEFQAFQKYRKDRSKVIEATENSYQLPAGFIRDFISQNSNYFEGYVLAGDYYLSQDSTSRARAFYEFALQKEFEKLSQRRKVEEKLSALK
jgi:hypothetical protein